MHFVVCFWHAQHANRLVLADPSSFWLQTADGLEACLEAAGRDKGYDMAVNHLTREEDAPVKWSDDRTRGIDGNVNSPVPWTPFPQRSSKVVLDLGFREGNGFSDDLGGWGCCGEK